MDLSACGALRTTPLTGNWYRALNLKYWNSRLATRHTQRVRSRFSSATPETPGHRLLYLGDNHQATIYEVGALLGDPNKPISNPRGTWVLMCLKIVLHRVVDLCDVAQQGIISTNPQELTGNWADAGGSAPTQTLGEVLFHMPGIEGFTYPSAKTGSQNLAVFMDKLDSQSQIQFLNDLTGETEVFK